MINPYRASMQQPINPLIQMFGGGFPQILQQFKANPMQIILQRRFNIPQNMTGDPNAMIQHLLTTDQISQNQFDSAYSFMRRLGW